MKATIIRTRLHEPNNTGIMLTPIILNEVKSEYTAEKFKQWITEMFTHRLIDADNTLKEDLLKNATPQIKGEITKGKLKWRGITLTVSPEGQYLTQRGERISRIV